MPAARPRAPTPRIGEVLVGVVNGSNTVFQTPAAFINEGGTRLALFYNGVLLREGAGADYQTSESGGSGTGWDTVTLAFAPLPGDALLVDFFVR